MENLLKNIEELREKFLTVWQRLDVERMRSKAGSLKLQMNKPGFWDDQSRAVEISKEAEELDKEASKWEQLKDEITELEEFIALAQNEQSGQSGKADAGLADEMQAKYCELSEKFRQLEFYTLFSGDYDQNPAILSIHAGTGGVDAQDWAGMLERMYLRFAEKKGYQAQIIDRNTGQEAGIKSATISIKGRWAYGNLRSENGVHRLVRISPFDAEAMRHTSFALVEVIPVLPEAHAMEIKDEDLRIDVFRSSGPGGQGVNTTDSAVRIVHLPSGITATCQSERSQHQNKENALKIIKSKLYQIAREEKKQEEQKLRGDALKAEWGKQIRSYVLQPYQMVKDHRTGHETSDVKGVLDGSLEPFIESFLAGAQKEDAIR